MVNAGHPGTDTDTGHRRGRLTDMYSLIMRWSIWLECVLPAVRMITMLHHHACALLSACPLVHLQPSSRTESYRESHTEGCSHSSAAASLSILHGRRGQACSSHALQPTGVQAAWEKRG